MSESEKCIVCGLPGFRSPYSGYELCVAHRRMADQYYEVGDMSRAYIADKLLVMADEALKEQHRG